MQCHVFEPRRSLLTHPQSDQQAVQSFLECRRRDVQQSASRPQSGRGGGGGRGRGGGRGGSGGRGGGGGRSAPGRGMQRPGPPSFNNSRPNTGSRPAPNRQFQQPDYDGDRPVMNADIRVPEVRVLDNRKEGLGVMSTREALDLAAEQDVDLIMLNPEAKPPLVRLVQLNKLKYEQSKAEQDQRKKQRESRQDLKELRFRPFTEEHDYGVRLKNAKKFISKGDKVKLTMRFKGREMDFRDDAQKMFERFVTDVGADASIAQPTSMQGFNMTLILTPAIKK